MINPIPAMIDPLSKYWEQPDHKKLTFQTDRVLMTKETINDLKEYSTSIPTGAYIGKMWKLKDKKGWTLCWYGKHSNPDFVSINYMPIKEVWTSKQ